MTSPTTPGMRRTGAQTRAEICRVALEMFTASGYESTSMREIADALGIKKASLYYHFAGKEDILRALFDQRGTEAEDLLRWITQQPPAPELAKAAVLRWVQLHPADKLRGIRFLAANPLLGRTLAESSGARIGTTLTGIAEALSALLPRRRPADVLQLRMALLSINAAVEASAQTPCNDEDILAAARSAATALMDGLLANSTSPESGDDAPRACF